MSNTEKFLEYVESMGEYFGAEDSSDWSKEELYGFIANINEYFWEETYPVKVGETPDDCEFALTDHGKELADARTELFAKMKREMDQGKTADAAADSLLRDLASTMYGPA